ncbi:MAG: ABC transporter substrate-binding protein [Tannerellaceae bacterium]|nr:ABC transporter substrate-binding protein [Tannerellaceae bacterium]
MVEIKDLLGRKVTIPAEPKRVVCLRPGALRLLSYIGETDKVVGIEQVETGGDDRPYMIAYPELLQLPFVGPRGGDNELILNVSPDLILTTYTTVAEANALEKTLNVPVVALEHPEFGNNAEPLYRSLELAGKILNRKERADSLIEYIRRTISDLNNRSLYVKNREIAYIGGIAHGRARGLNSTHPIYPPFIFTNVANTIKETSASMEYSLSGAYIDLEQLWLYNPETIFIDESGLDVCIEDMIRHSGWIKYFKSYNNKRIFTLLPYNSYAANYETALLNAWFVGKTLYPSEFADVDIIDKGNEIMDMFFGRPILNKVLTPNSFKSIIELKCLILGT